VVYAVLGLALLGGITLIGLVSSYARMAWKVGNYNSLRQEVDSLRERYQNLQKVADQTHKDLATMQLLASEVTVAFGIKRQLEGPDDISSEGRLVPTLSESLEQYNFLKSASFSRFHKRFPRRWQVNTRPGAWPVDGRLLSYFGRRDDPFSFSRAFHTGVDISAGTGTPVKATADGVVEVAEWAGGYGKLVVIYHGNGIHTYYGHLSRFEVIAGQEVRRGQVIARSGSTGRVTSPHLHYEVRLGGSPVNPYPFLRGGMAQVAKKDFPF
jgi:murein DD-endopeptidase MepM/ murein hydrolase activator NlpD